MDDGRGSDERERSLSDEIGDDPSLVTSMTASFYRGEMDRVTTWRTRLDQTTNWAVVFVATILTFSFSSGDNPHYLLLVGVLATVVFLFIEGTRYQEYDAWRARVRLLQQYLLAGVFEENRRSGPDWRDRLGADLERPTVNISLWQAVAHRLQRVYLLLLTLLLAAWTLRITVFAAGESWSRTASIGTVPGTVVVWMVAGGYLFAVVLSAWSAFQSRKREFDGETVDGSS